jgi:hypothetical protein
MPYSPAAGIVIDQRARYERLWGALTKRQAALAASAMADIEAELSRAKQGSWTSAMAAATLAQLGEATRGLSESQLRLLSRALPGIAGIAKDDLADYLGRLDEHYLGVARPLRWDALEWLEGYSRPLLRSRLRIYEKSFARYGAEAVAGIENSMAKSVLLGTPWTEARKSVMGLVRNEVGGRQWMVDRIIRTEVATVYSSTTMAALLEEDEPDDPMLKKLVAIWDKVTGLDSKMLHGQTRRVQDMFTDVVRGREFDAPPNRPNDREIVIGWRASWGDDAGFDAETRNADGSAADVLGDASDVSVDQKMIDRAMPRVDKKTELAEVQKAMDEAAARDDWAEWEDLEPTRRKLKFAVRDQDEWDEQQRILDRQDNLAGGRGLPLASNAEAIQALLDRGIQINHDMPDEAWVRVIEAELRSLGRLRAAPRVSQISLFASETAAAKAGADAGKMHLYINRDMHSGNVLDGFYAADAADRKRGRVPWCVVHGDAAASRLAERFESIAGTSTVPIVSILRHEFGHGIEHYLMANVTNSDDYRGLLAQWDVARSEVTKSTRKAWSLFYTDEYKDTWGRVSQYATTNDREMIAESMSLALSGEYDLLPEVLREPLRRIIEYVPD